ncbi:hypothetical protein SERLA73DRAFT_75652 [Serpula lacrymans var. lacrymans S7.3]|uniref:Uncharacterized protein n=2 Tax=Serpula lacrymans var. lacrymans TaxID=341189 RepID=F8Q3T7_SERL3|nr:uncharacterized protein SERLADRAFT_440415 [Serpula lacrymans var. lacrymans S7.9]EGN96793.1 hypothetical protein SERLA73DRAFT_75652 [Serpula lacrymans var. lacrymans S7.3]EGO22392.1 hypothetical protein SERLADRAFT_440415 [Serpula lacrymans var. lacrymans S7.9]
MAAIGSVFLGDFTRHRIFSSTPPSSPPASGQPPNPMSAALSPSHSQLDLSSVPEAPAQHPLTVITDAAAQLALEAAAATQPFQPSAIDPELSLELRLRLLEALLVGVRQDGRERKGRDKVPELKHGETLIRLTEDVLRRLNTVVESNEGLKRFMDRYDQHAHLLTPSFALAGTLPAPAPAYEHMSPEELDVFLTEMEPDIRAADRDMREIEMLEQRGVTGAGKLSGRRLVCRWGVAAWFAHATDTVVAEYQTYRPRLDAVLEAREEDVKTASALEKRIAALMEKHATHVSLAPPSPTLDTSRTPYKTVSNGSPPLMFAILQVDALSELFVAWDDVISEAENRVTRLERDREERVRLGYE